jgi:hypothetical protein
MNLNKRLEPLEASIHTHKEDPVELLAAGKHPGQELIMARLKQVQDKEGNKDREDTVSIG